MSKYECYRFRSSTAITPDIVDDVSVLVSKKDKFFGWLRGYPFTVRTVDNTIEFTTRKDNKTIAACISVFHPDSVFKMEAVEPNGILGIQGRSEIWHNGNLVLSHYLNAERTSIGPFIYQTFASMKHPGDLLNGNWKNLFKDHDNIDEYSIRVSGGFVRLMNYEGQAAVVTVKPSPLNISIQIL